MATLKMETMQWIGSDPTSSLVAGKTRERALADWSRHRNRQVWPAGRARCAQLCVPCVAEVVKEVQSSRGGTGTFVGCDRQIGRVWLTESPIGGWPRLRRLS